jgi:hypothetical protein
VLGQTQGIPSGPAILALTARVVQPSQTDRITLLQVCNARAESRHHPGTFMPGNEGELGFRRPIAQRRMKIRVTHAVRDQLDEDLARAWSGDGYFLNLQRLAEFMHHRGFHSSGHCSLILNWAERIVRQERRGIDLDQRRFRGNAMMLWGPEAQRCR